MKKRVAIIKKNLIKETKNSGFVLLGFFSGLALAKAFDKAVEMYPNWENALKISKHAVLDGGGLLLTYGSDESEDITKHIGYGVLAAGALEGIKLIPFVKEQLSGLGGLSNTYYTENSEFNLGDFGLNALPVNSINLEEAPTVSLNLPELGAGLGFNPEQTRIDGLGFNPSQTDDADVKGII